MDENKEKLELISMIEELDKEDRRKLLNVGEIMIALKNLATDQIKSPKATA